MGALSAGELAGERIGVAYETKDQEDEHSCFSDNTTVDIVGNATGIRMAYLADQPGVDGTSLSDVVAAVDPELDADLRDPARRHRDRGHRAAGSVRPAHPRRRRAPGRVALLALITELEDQGDAIAALADELGYSISLALD